MQRYVAIFKDKNKTVVIEYRPLYDIQAGAIEILSIDIQARPVSPFEQRKHRRGLVLDDEEQHAETMQPYTRLEQLNLFK